MKNRTIALAIMAALSLVGCRTGTSGGQGAAGSDGTHLIGRDDQTFNLIIPEVRLRQGESKTIAIRIDRSLNFAGDVKLQFGELPEGITLKAPKTVLLRSQNEVSCTLSAEPDASLGRFSILVTGEPVKGRSSTNQLSVTVESDQKSGAGVSDGSPTPTKREKS